MAIIKLTRGFETIVDDDLFEDLSSYNWYASGPDGRPARRLKAGPRKLIYMYHQILHVLPWVLRKLGLEVDHDNWDPLDNRKDNLKIVTHQENMRNTLRYGVRQGICYDTTHDRYKVYIDGADLPRINVGTYRTQEEARLALKQAKREIGLEDNQN